MDDHSIDPHPPFDPAAHLRLHQDLWFDRDALVLWRNGQPVELTKKEALLMSKLSKKPGCPYDIDSLAAYLTPPGREPISKHSIEQIVSNLRNKFDLGEASFRILYTRWGIGYALCPQDTSDEP